MYHRVFSLGAAQYLMLVPATGKKRLPAICKWIEVFKELAHVLEIPANNRLGHSGSLLTHLPLKLEARC